MRARPRRISRCVSNSRYGTLRFLALLCGLPWAAGQAQYASAGALRGGTAGIGADVCPLAAPEAGSASMCGRPLSGLGRTDRYAPHDAHATAWSIVTSAVVPGTGQALLRVDRFLPYLAFEAYSWIQYAAHSRTARDRRDAYRQLAARVARSPFSVVTPTGDWPYYERMEHFPESGRLEIVPGGILDPEPDTTTYNGSVWLLARRTYWSDINTPPDTASAQWKRSLEFYLHRAYDQPYWWTWQNSPYEYDEFRRLIRRSNDSKRKAFQDLGAVLANHVLSTIDAYVTVRLRRRPVNEPGGWELSGSLPLSSLVQRTRRR
jgi:hypothetical protein